MSDSRLNKVRKYLGEKNLDGLLVSNFYNIFYLIGFKTLVPEEREGFILITKENTYLFSDGRYLSAQSKSINFIPKILTPEKRLIKHLQEIVQEEKIKRLGFEEEDLKYIEYKSLAKNLNKLTLFPLQKIIVKLRSLKEKEEMAKIREACSVADRCLEEVVKTIKAGQTEKEIAVKIEFWLKKNGYDISFHPIVAVNENAAIPHYDTRRGNGKVKKGSILLIDYGTKVEDYCSDTTRMFFIGKPSDPLMKAYETLKKIQQKTIRRVQKIKQLRELDAFCRELLIKEGFPNYSHSTGHGVGLEVHERPLVSLRSGEKVAVNQVFTIEPGIYINGRFGMRIEDTILVKEKGVEILTKFPKTLRIL